MLLQHDRDPDDIRTLGLDAGTKDVLEHITVDVDLRVLDRLQHLG